MKVYSDSLERGDLWEALPEVSLYLEAVTIKRPRTRSRGWTVRLEALRNSGHYRNSGQYGAEGTRAATWDEHGEWMARLFEKDPNAKITYYDGAEDFHAQTAGKYRRVEA